MGVLIFFQALFSNQPGHRWGHSGQPGLRCDQPGRWCGQPGHRCDQPGLTEYRVRLVYGKDLPVHLDHNLPNPVLRGPQDLTDQDLALNQLLVTVSICLFSKCGRFLFLGRDRSVRLTGPFVLEANRSVLWTVPLGLARNRSVRWTTGNERSSTGNERSSNGFHNRSMTVRFTKQTVIDR